MQLALHIALVLSSSVPALTIGPQASGVDAQSAATVASVARHGTLELGGGSGCSPSWTPTFGGLPELPNYATTLATFDDGSGPALYAAVANETYYGIDTAWLARWDGTSWIVLDPVFNGAIGALAVFDDGSGAALYAGGAFTQIGALAADRIARWDGANWSAVGGGVDGSVGALLVHDDGSGPALYVGGSFQRAGGLVVNGIARWRGGIWSALGTGLAGSTLGVGTMAVHDEGAGPLLFVGGRFEEAGGSPANNVARWNGASWSALSLGMDGMVLALVSFVEAGSPTLFAGGDFQNAGGVSARRVARWRGSIWSPLGMGMNSTVHDLAVHDDGSGPALYAGGLFTTAGAVPSANRVARWRNEAWSGLGSGIFGTVRALHSHDDGSGSALFACGKIGAAGGEPARQVVKWQANRWSGMARGPSSTVLALAVHDDGVGPALYAGGEFLAAAGEFAPRIARWDAGGWSPVGGGFDASVHALAVHDDGSGPALYAGGDFITAGAGSASRIARWDGVAWTALGAGVNDRVYALAVHDDGSGPALYVGGSFTTAGGLSASRIARWQGGAWSALGTGTNASVVALCVFDDGTGPALYAGGEFSQAGGQPASRIARWDGSSWTALSSGVDSWVGALAVHDEGNGPALFVGGGFWSAGGLVVRHVARWDGLAWSALGSGMGSEVRTLASHDDGTGAGGSLFAGGAFGTAGGVIAHRIARWHGASWSSLGSGMDLKVRTLLVHDDGLGPALVAGGEFRTSAVGDSFLARWSSCIPPEPGSAYCFGDGSGTTCPCGNTSAAGSGCLNSSGVGAVLGASGTQSVAADDLLFTAHGMIPNQSALLFVALNAVNGGAGAPFGDGLRCAGGGVRRLGIRVPDPSSAASWGPGLASIGGWTAGDARRFQAWYRNSTGSPCGTNFNLSNGYELSFGP